MMASMPHAAICIITDEAIGSKIRGIYKMKGQFTSHLSWICLYVGFHTLGVYIHNDTILAFGQFVSQILIEPSLASLGYMGHHNGGYMNISINLMPLGPGDLLFHHAIGLGLHVSILILLKGSLDASGSKLSEYKTMDQSSTYLASGFGDYLFFNSTTLMNGYNTFGPNDLSIVSWGHFSVV